ncbi:MAG: gas vesicle protein GvpD P-loop domain-containing protein [Thermoplasmataceae archaeon]
MDDNKVLGFFSEFFNQKYGKSLIIKGKPGSGKTTFVLEFTGVIYKENPVHYLSSRFSDDPLKEIFDFIDEVSYRANKDAIEYKEDFKSVKTDSLKKLEQMIEEKEVNSSSKGFNSGLIFNIQEVIPEINAIYSFVDENAGTNPIIILDSIEALSQKYGIDEGVLFSVLQNDLVEHSGAGLIVVLENTGNAQLEYFADGVVSLDYKLFNDYLLRTLRIEKFRGLAIGSNPTYLYSLKDGRFNAFPQPVFEYPKKRLKKPKDTTVKEYEVPLGNNSFSSMITGGSEGVPLGTVVLIHRKSVSENLDNAVNLFKNNLIKRTISEGRGVIDVTSSSYETSRTLVSVVDTDLLKHYITAERTKRSNPYVINLEGKSMFADFPNEVIDFFMSSSVRPNVYFFSTDFLSFTYGQSFIGELINIINEIRITGIVVIIADNEYYEKLSHYSGLTVHFLESSGSVLVSSGTNKLFAMKVSKDEENWPTIELTEIN